MCPFRGQKKPPQTQNFCCTGQIIRSSESLSYITAYMIGPMISGKIDAASKEVNDERWPGQTLPDMLREAISQRIPWDEPRPAAVGTCGHIQCTSAAGR